MDKKGDVKVLAKGSIVCVCVMLAVIVASVVFVRGNNNNTGDEGDDAASSSYSDGGETPVDAQDSKTGAVNNGDTLSQLYNNDLINNKNTDYIGTVVIDAGHGGKDSGTIIGGADRIEKEINLAVLLKVKKLFDSQNRINVLYTRTDDTFLSLEERIGLANDNNADFFISIHCNSHPNKDRTGFEVLWYDPSSKAENNNGRVKGDEISKSSERLANLCLKEGLAAFPRTDGGTTVRRDLVVLCDAKMPAVLLELGYLSNEDEADALLNDANLDKIAQGIYSAAVKAFEEGE